jgi:hypothetical protein
MQERWSRDLVALVDDCQLFQYSNGFWSHQVIQLERLYLVRMAPVLYRYELRSSKFFRLIRRVVDYFLDYTEDTL